MINISSRLRVAERRISRMGNPRDALLMAPIVEGTFTAGQLDELFGVIEGTFRSATLATAALLAADGPLGNPPGSVLGDFAMYVGQSSIGLRGDRESTLVRCKQVLIRSEDLKDPYLLPEFDNRNRVLRGLAQRLVQRDGLEALGEAVQFYCENPIDNWPLPVLDRPERARILSLVAPIQPDNDYLLVLWRNPDGTPYWDPTDRKA